MSASLTGGARALPGVRDDFADRRKLDLWICWWSIPVFYALFGVIFAALARLMPPPAPGLTVEQIGAFIQANRAHIKIAIVLLALSLGFASLSSGLIVVQMKRMSVSPVYAYAYLTVLGVAALPGCLFCGFMFALAALRPDRDPQLVALLYDMGLLSFVGSLGCFVVQYMIFAIAILRDRNGIFPKWLGYMSIWGAVTEFVAAPIWIFRDGPYAWNGAISFWLGTLVFCVWEFMLVVRLRKAVQLQPAAEEIPL